MSWSSVHLQRADEIRVDVTSVPGYVQIVAGPELTIMMPVAKAAEVHAALGEALAATPGDQDAGEA